MLGWVVFLKVVLLRRFQHFDVIFDCIISVAIGENLVDDVVTLSDGVYVWPVTHTLK